MTARPASEVPGWCATPARRIRVVGEPIVGHVVYTVVAGEGEILWLEVDPAARRMGHGRALMAAALDDWRAEGVGHGWLEVRTDNAAARGLYEALGFARVGVRSGYYADGHDALVYRWQP